MQELRQTWLAEQNITVYFAKLEKEQVKLKAMEINWDDTQKVTQAAEEMYNIHIFDEIQLMEWEDKAETDKTWETCKKFFKDYYQAKKRFGSMQTTNHGFESAANLNEVKNDEIEIMERIHGLEQINVMANTTKSMVELCAQLALAKAEQVAHIAQLNTKIDRLKKWQKNSQPQRPRQPRQRGESDIAQSAEIATKQECVGRTRKMRRRGRPTGSR